MSSSLTGMDVSPRFGMFDCVSLTKDLSTLGTHGEALSLQKGKKGCVLLPGDQKNSYIVEFRTGNGSTNSDFSAVNLPDELLLLENSNGKKFEPGDWEKPRYWF
jgi:hypothetical protein